MFKRTRRSAALIIMMALCGLLASVASASAANLYVSSSAPAVPGGKTCAEPAFNEIQAAVNAASPGAKVTLCPGTFTEDVQIEKGLKIVSAGAAGTAKVVMPEKPAQATTPCDSNQAETISICTPETVSLTGISVTAKESSGSCAGGLIGIAATGGGSFKATNITVQGAANVPFSGCQRGIALETGGGAAATSENVTLSKVALSEYQKGALVARKGTTISLTSSTLTGVGPTDQIAQNGFQAEEGVLYKIKSSTISGNECNLEPACGATATQSAGILTFGATAGSSISNSTIKENDFGAYYVSESATQPASPEVTFTKDQFTSNRYEQVILDQGKAALKSDTLSGVNEVGIELYQYEGQTLASESTATSTKVEGSSKYGIKVYSDKGASDIPGTFTFSKGTLSAPIENENPAKFKIIL